MMPRDLLALTRSFIEGGPEPFLQEQPTRTEKAEALLRLAEPKSRPKLERNRANYIVALVAEICRYRSECEERLQADQLGMPTPRSVQEWERQMAHISDRVRTARAIEDDLLIPKLVEAELSELRDGILYLNPERPGDRERILAKHRL